MSLAARKTAFLNVLSANLDQNIQSEIKAFWEEKYSNKPQFGVSAFLDELYSNYDISIKKGQLFRELSRATTRAGFETNKPNKTDKNVDSITGTNLSSLMSEEGLRVFQALHESFLASAKPADRVRITDIQCDRIKNQNIVRSDLAATVSAWLKNGSATEPKGITLATLKKIFNLGYVECCEIYGPVKTDQMLNSALQKTNDLPESLNVPPVQFI